MKKLLFSLLTLLLAVSSYGQFDTTGIYQWQKMYNSMHSWDEGSFNQNSFGQLDYGWGVYNGLNHDVQGDSLFAIKLQDGSWKNLYIQIKKSTKNIYAIRYADLDGQNEVIDYIDNSKYSDKLFTYYSIKEKKIIDRAPEKSAWDLLLTKYHDNIIDYNVTGLLLNENASASLFSATDSISAFNATLADTTTFSDSLTIIGNSWYRLEGMTIVTLDTIAYFIKTADKSIYRLNVTYFESGFSGQGRLGFRYQKLKPAVEDPVNDTLTMGPNYANDVYFMLSDGNKHEASRSSWDIAFKTGMFSASILTNTTMGIELYTYPNIDATSWQSYGVNEPSVENIAIYPNPVVNLLNISTNKIIQGEAVTIRVLDVLGKEVFNRNSELKGSLQIDVSTFPNGLYFLHLKSGAFTAVERFIKTN